MSFIKIFLGNTASQLVSEQNCINIKNNELRYRQTVLNGCKRNVQTIEYAQAVLEGAVKMQSTIDEYEYLFEQYVVLQVLRGTFDDLYEELDNLIYPNGHEEPSPVLDWYEEQQRIAQQEYDKVKSEIELHEQNISAIVGNTTEPVDLKTNTIEDIQTISTRLLNTMDRIDTSLQNILNTDPEYIYFTIESLEDNNKIYWKASSNAIAGKVISVSFNNGDSWTNFASSTDGTLIVTLKKNKKILIKGSNPAYASNGENYTYFSTTKLFNISGNLMSLLFSDSFRGEDKNINNDWAFSKLFYGSNVVEASNAIINANEISNNGCDLMFGNCTSLISAPQLPAKTLNNFSYSAMFQGCESLEYGPQLPATTLGENCYYLMFENCTSMYSGPRLLPANIAVVGCYTGMFKNCTSLYRAPQISATTVNDSCFEMFNNCTSLRNAPSILPATTLSNWSYNCMFKGCTALINAPELPATTLTEGCYHSMFEGCISLTTAPQLPATSLAPHCYGGMFWDCTSLTTAPELPATSLAYHCYDCMFMNCISLVNAPELPATTLEESCYEGMFKNCTSLVKAPELLASTLGYACYEGMFKGCSSLNYIKCLSTIYDSRTYDNWVEGVSSTGTFVKLSDVNFDEGESGIPTGWTVENV